MLGWLDDARQRREERERKRAEQREKRQKELQEWLRKKNLEEQARKAAYATSIRRQLGDLDVKDAEKSVEKARKFVHDVLNDLDNKKYGFWRNKEARDMFFKVSLIRLAGVGC